jgi:PAS domain S-box-containing protein
MVAAGGTASAQELERDAARRRGAERGRGVGADERPSNAMRGAGPAFRTLAENVRDYAIFLLDTAGVITFWGEGARLMTGWSKDEAEGAHLRLLYPAGSADDGTADEHLALAGEKGEYSGEGSRVRSDRSTIWAGVTLTALRDDEGALMGFAQVSRDLTARHTAEMEIESARLAAEVANRAKSAFLATMSHEIRTPLNAILGFLELMELEVGGPLTKVQRMFLDRARASDRHLMELVDDVLDLSKLEADRLAVDDAVGSLRSALDGTMSLVDAPARAKRLAITSEAEAKKQPDVHYHGDEVRVRQILANLLTNSVKFTEAGGHITITSGQVATLPPEAIALGDGPWAYVRVEDTGAGIAADRLAAVFEPFVQVDMSHTRRYGGSGLGLAISRRLARLMGGDITGTSTLGEGSTFVLWLRAAPAPALARPSASARAPDDLRPSGAPLAAGAPPLQGTLGTAAAAVLGDIRRVLHAHVARLRSDPMTPSARRMPERALEDHLGTFIADLAQSVWSGEAAEEGTDAFVVAERHGRQRARLGWSAAEVRREFVILREELSEGVRRRVDGIGTADVEMAVESLAAFLIDTERASMAAFASATSSGSAPTGHPASAEPEERGLAS